MGLADPSEAGEADAGAFAERARGSRRGEGRRRRSWRGRDGGDEARAAHERVVRVGATADEAAAEDEGRGPPSAGGRSSSDTRLSASHEGDRRYRRARRTRRGPHLGAARARRKAVADRGRKEEGVRARQAGASSSGGATSSRGRLDGVSEGEPRGGTNLRRGPSGRGVRVEGSARANATVIAGVLIRGVGASRPDRPRPRRRASQSHGR